VNRGDQKAQISLIIVTKESDMPSVFITGSNRGLGLEWVRQYAEAGWRIFATCRHPAEALELNDMAAEHPHISVYRMDITKPDEINGVVRELLDERIDVLINNAGVYLEKYEDDSLDRLRFDDWEWTMRVNTLGCLRVTAAFMDMVSRSDRRLVVALSSHMGSITEIEVPGSYYYRSSKAALNAALKGLSHELKSHGIGVLILHPGWNNTRMGGAGAPFKPVDTVAGMRKLIEQFTMADTGRFLRFDGEEIPW
jgi:NAD(P)-dependent dehydrogenase (short-subunit alcohol dehydrogenase family)